MGAPAPGPVPALKQRPGINPRRETEVLTIDLTQEDVEKAFLTFSNHENAGAAPREAAPIKYDFPSAPEYNDLAVVDFADTAIYRYQSAKKPRFSTTCQGLRAPRVSGTAKNKYQNGNINQARQDGDR